MSYFLSAIFARFWAALQSAPASASENPRNPNNYAANFSAKLASGVPCQENLFGAMFAPAPEFLENRRPHNDGHF